MLYPPSTVRTQPPIRPPGFSKRSTDCSIYRNLPSNRPEVFVHLQVRSEVDQIADNPLSWLEFLLEIPLTDNEKN